MKRTYTEFLADLSALYLRSDITYKDFETFVEYAKNSDRFKTELGYSYSEVEDE